MQKFVLSQRLRKRVALRARFCHLSSSSKLFAERDCCMEWKTFLILLPFYLLEKLELNSFMYAWHLDSNEKSDAIAPLDDSCSEKSLLKRKSYSMVRVWPGSEVFKDRT